MRTAKDERRRMRAAEKGVVDGRSRCSGAQETKCVNAGGKPQLDCMDYTSFGGIFLLRLCMAKCLLIAQYMP